MSAYPDHLTDDDECLCCGGEGFIFECFDGCCEDCDIGCDDCTRPCPECNRKGPAPDALSEILSEALAQSAERT